MKINRFIFPLSLLLFSSISIGYASWQYNGDDALYANNFISFINDWKFNISMNEDGKVYDGDDHVGHAVYEGDSELKGGSVTSDFIFVNDEAQVNNVVAYKLGSNINLFSATDVEWYLPKAIHYDETDKEVPIVGVDHLGTYTTIGGPLYRRFVTVHIPEGYTFIGNYAFYLMGSDHADSNIEFNIPHSVTYIGHEAFNFSTLNQMKDMWDQKYKFRVNYDGTAEEFVSLINHSKEVYESTYKGLKREEMEEKAKEFQKEVDDTGGIIYSGSEEYSWFFRPRGQEKNYLNSNYWPAQRDYIDVYCNNGEIVRYYANSPISEECISKIKHYKNVDQSYIEPEIIK